MFAYYYYKLSSLKDNRIAQLIIIIILTQHDNNRVLHYVSLRICPPSYFWCFAHSLIRFRMSERKEKVYQIYDIKNYSICWTLRWRNHCGNNEICVIKFVSSEMWTLTKLIAPPSQKSGYLIYLRSHGSLLLLVLYWPLFIAAKLKKYIYIYFRCKHAMS